MKLSVVVVNWNTRELLQECLEKIIAGVQKLDHEIIVIDNGSTDGSVEMVRTLFPSVHRVENAENIGFPRAVNQGIRGGVGELIALINSDVFISKDSLVELVEYLDENRAVAAVGPQLVDRYGHLQYSAGFAPSPMTALKQIIGIRTMLSGRSQGVYSRSKYTRTKMNVDWLSAACPVIRMKAVDDVGLLDEAHFMYAEDTEYGLRLRDKGWQLHLLPWVRVLHLGGASSSSSSETKLLWLGGMFRIAAGRLSRPAYTLFGFLLGIAFLQRFLMISVGSKILRRDFSGVVSAHDSWVYALTAFRLGFRRPEYASAFCTDIEEGIRKAKDLH